MSKILVVGSNGFSGSAIVKRLLAEKTKYEVVGCSLNPNIHFFENFRFIQTDIRQTEQLKALFELVDPDVVINSSALSVPDYCETHRTEAYETNVTAVRNLAVMCEQHESRLIHLSTDFVFDGNQQALYQENDIPFPVNYYGMTKLQGEQMIASHCSDWAVARVAVVYGPILQGQHGNILHLTSQRLKTGVQLKAVNDQYRTPTWVGDVAQGVELLISHPNNGIYHICGKDHCSIAEIAFKVADHLQLNRTLIAPCTTEEMHEQTPRPKQSGMSCQKAMNELGYKPLSLEEGIRKMFEQYT